MGDRAAKTAVRRVRPGRQGPQSGKRLELLDLLAQGERTVDALARRQRAGAEHRVGASAGPEAANMVTTRREGTKIYYRLAGIDVAQLLALVRAVASTHLPDVEAAASAYLGPDTEQVTRAELLKRIQTGQVTVIDVRPREEYAPATSPPRYLFRSMNSPSICRTA